MTRADDTETCFQWFWKEVQWLEDHPRHATSLLLMTNPYWASNFDAFEQFGDALTQALQSATESKVEGLGFEGQIQLVFFHPQYVFRDFLPVRKSISELGYPSRRGHGDDVASMAWNLRAIEQISCGDVVLMMRRPKLFFLTGDGGERAGADAAANYGRRSPIPMINILRTPQVKAAQKGLPTGLVYSQNEETLGDIGTEKLEEMLRTLDWSAVNDVKVDRSQVEVLKIARKMMAQGGGIKATDDLTLTGGEAAAASAAATEKAAESDIVVADWASAVDEASGNTYYYNTKTGATSWVWPPTV